MSPKTTTISLTLLALTLTLALPSTQADCPGFASIPEILKHYDFPPSIFPNNVKSYSCEPITNDSVKLSINLEGVCVVTREAFFVKNVLTCSEKILATISHGNLTDVKGVTVRLFVKIGGNDMPLGELMTITGAKVVGDGSIKLIKFFSVEGESSPPFPFDLFPPEAPKCDPKAAILPFISRLLVA